MDFGELAVLTAEELETGNEHKELVVTNCGYFIQHKQKQHYFEKDNNEQYLLLYNHLGPISIKMEESIIRIPPHSILIFPPKEPRAYFFERCETSERYYVYFKGKKATEVLRRFNIDNQKVLYTPDMPSIIPIFKKILRDFKEHNFDEDIYRTTYLLQILSSISLAVNNPPLPKELEPLIKQIKFIEANYYQPLTLDQLSNQAMMSKNSFMQLFKKHTGKSPIQYLLDFRIKIAQGFLLETTKSIGEISNSVGFENPLYFSTLFKKKIGLSPKLCREQSKPPPPPPKKSKQNKVIHRPD